jgi:capsular polysaccharide biosynthesis protein
VCSLVSGSRWHLGFYHWFMDCLPRLIAAKDYAQRTGSRPRVIVPSPLTAWQEHSLLLLGIGPEHRISDQTHGGGGLAVDLWIEYVSHRWQRLGDAPFDAASPWAFRRFADELGAGVASLPTGTPKRLYLTRRGVPTRQVINEDDVMGVLEPHGFVVLQCDSLSLAEQIALFRDATHIVAPHGASLTNLLYVRQASVLEIFQEGHGVRPDFFQLAMIKGLDYQHCVCATESAELNCRVDPQIVRQFLERTL